MHRFFRHRVCCVLSVLLFLCMVVNVLIDFQNRRNSYNRLQSVPSFGFYLAFSVVISITLPSLAISRQRHSVSACLRVMSMCVFMHDHIVKVCEHDSWNTTCGNFTKFTT